MGAQVEAAATPRRFNQAALLRRALAVADKFDAREDYWESMGALITLIPIIEAVLEKTK